MAVCTSIGLSKSDVARILGVSRPALYAWINGESEPQGENAARLRVLGRLAAEACRDTSRPLFHEYVNQALHKESASILDLLLGEAWDEPRLRHLFIEARRLTTARDARIARAKPAHTPTAAVQGDTLRDNLTALGVEG
jgi:transcriptional regulator with XRE-family HTH domain